MPTTKPDSKKCVDQRRYMLLSSFVLTSPAFLLLSGTTPEFGFGRERSLSESELSLPARTSSTLTETKGLPFHFNVAV